MRFRLGQALGLQGGRCANIYSTGAKAGEVCAAPLEEKGLHGMVCKVGGLVNRRHAQLLDLLAHLLTLAGYHVLTEQWEPRWDREVVDRDGNPVYATDEHGVVFRDEQGRPVRKKDRAKLDHRWEAPPEEPRGYGDVVVSHPNAQTWEREAAQRDGATAEAAARGKHERYPPGAVRPGKLRAFSVESYGRWGEEAERFLKHAAGRAAARTPGVQRLGGRGTSAVLGSWHAQLSCVLQKANVAMLRGAMGDARTWAEGELPAGAEEARVFESLEDLLAQATELADLAARA